MSTPVGLDVFAIVRNIHEKTKHNVTFSLLGNLYASSGKHGFHMSSRLIQEDFILINATSHIRAKLGTSLATTIDLESGTIHFRTVTDIFHGILKIYKALNKAGYNGLVEKWIEMFESCINKLDDYIDVVKTTEKMHVLRIRSSKSRPVMG